MVNIKVKIMPAFQVQTNEQKEKVRVVRDERKKFKEISEDLRKKHREHKENFERAREPLLQGLASKSDLKLFKEAQAKACEVLVRASSMTFYYRVILNSCRQTLVIFVIKSQPSWEIISQRKDFLQYK